MAIRKPSNLPDADDFSDAFKSAGTVVSNVSPFWNRSRNKPSTLAEAGVSVGERPISTLHPEKPTAVETAGNVANTAVDVTLGAAGIGAMVAGLSPILSGVVGTVSGWIGKLGEKIGFKSVENAGKNTQAKITKFSEKTLEHVVPSNGFTKTIARWVGNVSNAAGNGVNKIISFIRLDGFAAKRNAANAAKHFTNASKLFGGVIADAKDLPHSLQQHAKDLHGLIKGDVSKIDAIKFETIKTALGAEVTKLTTSGSPLTSREELVLGKLNKAAVVAEKAVNSHASSLAWKSQGIGNAIKNLPQTLGKSQVLQGAMNASFIAGSVIHGAIETKGFLQNLSALKEMHKDASGKSASTADVLFGTVSAPVAEARSKLVKNFILSGVTDIASLAVAVAGTISKRVPVLAFFAPQLVSGAVSKLELIGESAAPSYAILKQAHTAGQQIPAEEYAKFLYEVSPQLARGGQNSVFTRKLAEQFAEQNVSPAQIMREATNGQLVKRVEGLIAASEAAKPTALATTAIAGQHAQPAHSHVAALEGKRNGQVAQPVIGKHTAEIAVANAAKANQALSPSGAGA